MTFNPLRYETVYGVQLIDDLHNFMPEVLYDTQMFPDGDILGYFRHRINSLFNDVYVRQRAHYTLYQSNQRRDSYSTWQQSQRTQESTAANSLINLATSYLINRAGSRADENSRRNDFIRNAVNVIREINRDGVTRSQNIGNDDVDMSGAGSRDDANTPTVITPASPIVSPTNVPVVAAEVNIVTPPRRNTPLITPPAPRRPRSYRTNRVGILDFMNVLDNSDDLENRLINEFYSPSRVDWSRNPFESWNTDIIRTRTNPVILVGHTVEELTANTTLLPNSQVSVETDCAICQSHENEDNADNQWRRLNCNHTFHVSCIDRWFARDFHCPMCRADVRSSTISS